MPRIFDNIEHSLLPALADSLKVAERADFCVGYFNLRGWRHLSPHVDRWAGGDHSCRLLIGMHVTPSDELRLALRTQDETALDNQTAIREKRRIAEEFRQQLTYGSPSNDDEATLRQLASQIRANKLAVKVYLRHPLHAKLYFSYRQDANNPVTGFLGSSNLTLAGLAKQGELNVDVLEHDACSKLVNWFEDRFAQAALQAIADFFGGQNLTLPPGKTWRNVAANVFEVVDGKRILFENDNSLFHTLRQGEPVVELIRENVAAAMEADDIHEDVHRFFSKLVEMVKGGAA